MPGIRSSQHILTVHPDLVRIAPCYLYAFLSGHLGAFPVTADDYGTVVQHNEPAHITELPAPRLGGDLEPEVVCGISDGTAGMQRPASRLTHRPFGSPSVQR